MLQIVTLFHNASPWLQRCLENIKSQSIQDWRCHLVDDCSTDGSFDVAKRIIDSRFVLLRNESRLYQCSSSQLVLNNPSLDAYDICVAVDGDDYLPDNFVFQRVLDAYADGKTWVTWGSEIRTDGVSDCNGPLENTADVRKISWRTSHLRTWKLFLWRLIQPEDFLGPDGNMLRVGGDLAAMYPMIEMAGNSRVKYLKSINYIYNRENLLCNFRVRKEEQLRNGEFLRSKRPYDVLPDNFMPS